LENLPVSNSQKTNSDKKTKTPGEHSTQKAPVEKTPSLKDTLDKINSIGKEEKSDKIELKDSPAVTYNKEETVVSISNSDLHLQYTAFIDRLKGEQPRLYSAFKLMVPQISDNKIITLNFQNNTILEEYKMRVKPSLLSFLREKLNNNFLDINEVVSEIENLEKPKLYSDSEKLQYMIEKNPALLKLKTKFNLDFD